MGVHVYALITMDLFWAKCVNRSLRKPTHTLVKTPFFEAEDNFIIDDSMDGLINLEIAERLVTSVNLYDLVSYWTTLKAILHVKMRYPFDRFSAWKMKIQSILAKDELSLGKPTYSEVFLQRPFTPKQRLYISKTVIKE